MRYRVEFRHKKDSFWNMPASKIVDAKNQKEAIKKFKKRRKNIIVESAWRE